MPKKIKALSNQCVGCGDNLIYNPETASLFCPSCKQTKKITTKSGMPKHDVKSSLNNSNKNKDWAETNKYMECPSCGASVILKNFQVTSACPYCDTSLMALTSEYNIQKPDSIIPFAISKKQAELRFKENLRNKTFAPKQFKQNIKADEIHAYYFPSIIFNANCSSTYSGRLYENYTETDENGLKETKRKYFPISGLKVTRHKNIEISASSKISQSELFEIRPYDFSKVQNYNDDYVYGYDLECNSNSIMETSKIAQSEIEDEIKEKILDDNPCDGVDRLDISTKYDLFNYSHCVLPLYRFNFTYKNVKYSNVMNGQTGLITGSYPKSSSKIILLILGILLAIGLPILIVLLMAL